MGRLTLVVALLVGGLGACTGVARNPAPIMADSRIRIEWEASRVPAGARIEGYVYNSYGHTADRMRLLVERLDATGQVSGASAFWVAGTIPQDSRAYFTTVVPAAPGYRVHLLGFDWIGRGGQ